MSKEAREKRSARAALYKLGRTQQHAEQHALPRAAREVACGDVRNQMRRGDNSRPAGFVLWRSRNHSLQSPGISKILFEQGLEICRRYLFEKGINAFRNCRRRESSGVGAVFEREFAQSVVRMQAGSSQFRKQLDQGVNRSGSQILV